MTSSASPVAMQDPRTGKATVWRKLGFALGDFSYNFVWYVVSALLLVFYTDVFLIPAAVVSLFVLLVRLSDAVIDPLVGSIADRTRTRWGRYRPWILFGPVVMVAAMTLTFWAHPTWPLSGKVTYAVVTFVAATIASTCVNMPYGALNAVVSLDTDERLSFASYRIVASSLGSTLVGFIILPLIAAFSGPDDDQARGYLLTIPTIGVIAVVLFFVCFVSTRELVAPSGQAKPAFKQLWSSVLVNRPLQLLLVGFFLTGFIGYGRIGILVYFFQYNVGDVALFSTFNLVATGATVIGAMLSPRLLKLFPSGNKAAVVIVGCLVQAVFFAVMFFAEDDMPLFFVLGGLAGLGQGIFSAMIFGMVPDTVEYGELKSGIRSEGFNYAFTSLALKWGGAAGPAALGLVLSMTGYLPNAQQNPDVLDAILLMMTIVPAVLSLVTAIPFFFYKISRQSFNEMVDELERRGDLIVSDDVVESSVPPAGGSAPQADQGASGRP